MPGRDQAVTPEAPLWRDQAGHPPQKHHIPLKTDHWDVSGPGFTELDSVAHAGHRADGEFAHSLNVTDIHTTWVETRGGSWAR